jgi:hypothetical protein
MRSRVLILTSMAMLSPASLLAQAIPVPTPRPTIDAPKPVLQPVPEQSRPSWNETSACAVQLKELNVKFKLVPPVKDTKGCSIAEPVEVETLPGGVALTPPGLLDCPTAAQLAQFTQTIIEPKAVSILGSSIKTVSQSSAYVCRTRNGSAKLSEHAFGRAIDVASFTTAAGKTIEVKAQADDKSAEARFLDEVRAAACGPFKTVLGPGSDPDHALHFHFDMALRKGKAYCINAAPKRTQTLRAAMTNDSLLSDIFNPFLRVEPCAAPFFSACALPQHSPPAPRNQ